jgi:hypothetical protein
MRSSDQSRNGLETRLALYHVLPPNGRRCAVIFADGLIQLFAGMDKQRPPDDITFWGLLDIARPEALRFQQNAARALGKAPCNQGGSTADIFRLTAVALI